MSLGSPSESPRPDTAGDGEPAEPGTFSVRGLSLAGFHRINVWHWDAPSADVPVVCVHGLTRQARDFDFLARKLLKAGRPVYCPDLVGRGRSDWLRDPLQYNLLQYTADMNAVLARIGSERVDWVGSSLGGLIGMLLAAQPGSPIRRLVLNDVGPFISSVGLRHIGAYIDSGRRVFESIEDAEEQVRSVLAPFGALTDAEWRHLTRHSVRSIDGGFELRHDPAIMRTYRQWQYMNVDLWRVWNEIQCPVLVLRGVDSDFLSATTLDRMARTGPNASTLEIAGCGHVPPLTRREQVAPIVAFLGEREAPSPSTPVAQAVR
jgi:pimeloyl-ACP methyl ester carboxylesterase